MQQRQALRKPDGVKTGGGEPVPGFLLVRRLLRADGGR
jgi:hypothetical protein